MSEAKQPDRRTALAAGAAAVAVGGALLATNAAHAAQVEDRGATIRIRALRATPVGAKAYIKIETNQNVFGWGEVTGLEPRVACSLAESLFELLDNENP